MSIPEIYFLSFDSEMPMIAASISDIITSVGGENRSSATLNFVDGKTHFASEMVKHENTGVTEPSGRNNALTKSVGSLDG